MDKNTNMLTKIDDEKGKTNNLTDNDLKGKNNKKSKDNKTLFTKEDLESLKKVRTLLIFAFVCVIVVSDFSIFTLAIFELLIEVVIYLFSNCIKYETKELVVEEN